MTLSVTGNIFIQPSAQIQEKKYKQAVYFSFVAVSKHPYKEIRTPHKISIYVPDDKLERARQVIRPGEMIYIRHGDLDATLTDQGAVMAEVKTDWKSIEHMTKVPGKEKQ
jgi:hypothetical protein